MSQCEKLEHGVWYWIECNMLNSETPAVYSEKYNCFYTYGFSSGIAASIVKVVRRCV